jgi:hypothetical protein
MFISPSLAEMLMKERVNDALRKAEQTRLIRVAEGSKEGRALWGGERAHVTASFVGRKRGWGDYRPGSLFTRMRA